MRKACDFQPNLTYSWLDLEHAKELQALSGLISSHPKIAELVWQDLTRDTVNRSGARGMAADLVFRALLLKQMHTWSYDELHFHLSDSQTYRTFCGMSFAQKTPARSTLAAAIKKIQPETLEAINRLLLLDARARKIENGKLSRVDCTVVETLMHPPSDSQQLWDCIRVMSRVMKRVRVRLPAGIFSFPNRQKRAKRRCREIAVARRKAVRRVAYRDLVKVAEEIQGKAQEALKLLQAHDLDEPTLQNQLVRFLDLIERTLDQTRRRIFDGQSVPATDKIVSVFEDHTDIIRKDFKETYYGHKICLSGGKSSMILDCQILEGNPADATLAIEAVERQREIYGQPPRQVVFDGSFASAANLQGIKKSGARDVVFTKGRSLKVSDMAKSLYVYRRLRRFRAGIEGCISFLKRTFGLDRCTWRSLTSFKSYVWSSIVSCNLLLMARATLSST